jgi:hypothetical protein
MRRCGAAAVLACAGYALPERERGKDGLHFLVHCHYARRVKLTARPNGTASHIPDRSAICLRSRCLCGRTHATITNARRLNEDACIRSRKLEPAFFSGLVFGHTILEIPKRGSLTILVIHSRRRSAITCPLAVSGKRRLLKRSLSCPRPTSGSVSTLSGYDFVSRPYFGLFNKTIIYETSPTQSVHVHRTRMSGRCL